MPVEDVILKHSFKLMSSRLLINLQKSGIRWALPPSYKQKWTSQVIFCELNVNLWIPSGGAGGNWSFQRPPSINTKYFVLENRQPNTLGGINSCLNKVSHHLRFTPQGSQPWLYIRITTRPGEGGFQTLRLYSHSLDILAYLVCDTVSELLKIQNKQKKCWEPLWWDT